MLVRAKERGFYGCLRETDDEFPIEGKPGKWMQPLGGQGQEDPGGDLPEVTLVTAYHVGAGRYGLKGSDGERIGEFAGTKDEAEAEAARMNGQEDPGGDLPEVTLVTAYHVGAGRYGLKGSDGERIGEFAGTKDEAEAEAARMNGQEDPGGDLPDA